MLNQQDEALFAAVRQGNVENVRKLIAEEANVNSYDGVSFIVSAAVKFSNNIGCRTAINTATTDAEKKALISQFQQRSLEMVKLLLENGASTESVIQTKVNILHEALDVFFQGDLVNIPLVRYLVVERKMDVNAKAILGTPLHYAARSGDIEAIGILLDNGAQVDAANLVNETPLHSAAMKGNLKAVKLLVEHGANVYAQFHHLKSKGWRTALEVVPEGEEHAELRKFLEAQQTTKAYIWDCIKHPTYHPVISLGALASVGACLFAAWKQFSPQSQKSIATAFIGIAVIYSVLSKASEYLSKDSGRAV